MIPQRTINKPISIDGIGLHTGRIIKLTFHPAPPNSGIRFIRTDLAGAPNIGVEVASVTYTDREITLQKGTVKIHTVEHVLSALYGLNISNAVVELDAPEPPVCDGSSKLFVDAILESGIVEQDAVCEIFKPERPFWQHYGDKTLVFLPDDEFRISYTSFFDHKLLGTQFLSLAITPESYCSQVATARTFGFLSELSVLWDKGQIQGGSILNAIVIGENMILNESLRFPDEFVRHKILDLIGAFAFLGRPIVGHCLAVKSGHTFDIEFVKKISKGSYGT